MTRELGVRIVAAAVLIPLVLALVWLGGWWFAGLLVLVGGLMAREWCAIVHGGSRVQLALHLLAVLAATLVSGLYGTAAALACIALIWLAASVHARIALHRHGFWVFAGVPYVALPLVALMALRADPVYGLIAVGWLFVVVWSADTAAYAAGRGIGGPKLAPSISPNKTWAGLAGAAVGAAFAGGLAGWLADLPWLAPVVVIAAVIGVVEQLGDLFESLLKRHHGVKDSGAVIPGHGGMLDRVDGLVAASLLAVLVGAVNSGADNAGAGLLAW
ncbi:MAG TPA: phosphatidate cytidylyltransferase [Aestuariivirgaceae bacterium]|nr:phosphatidate cytidylyltransferase [Aestuariivirgaceae bacterium]